MEEHKLFHERYFLERLLGRGNFSEVWLAKDTKTNIEVALKIYAPATGLDDAGLNVFAREFSLVVNANHKNLLKPLYYDSYERKPYLVLPFCKQGSILKLVGKLSEEDAWRLLRDVASGLSWLHSMNPPIIHQDIKPDNIMVSDNGDYMITDFGISTHLKSTLRKSLSSAFTSAGTIAYMAPERFGKDNTPIMANDIYSLGATVFEMLTGDTPFGDDGGLLQKKGAEIPELTGNYSEPLKKVIALCLKTNPWERPTAEQLERYAEAGLQGQAIHFEGEKTFFQKYKWVVIGICALFVIGGIVGGISYNNHLQVKAEKARMEYVNHHNDSIQSVIARFVVMGDSLVLKGDAKDENYEVAYLDALRSYRNAADRESEFLDGAVYVAKSELTSKMENLEKKLFDAYLILMEKAEIFVNDESIFEEFNARASSISSVIDIEYMKTVYGKDSLDYK